MCCEQDIQVEVRDYATEVWIHPAQTALPDSKLSPDGTIAAALKELYLSASGITTSKYQVCYRVNSIENLDKIDVALPTGKQNHVTCNTAQEEASAQDNASPNERQNNDAGRVVTGAVAV